MRFCSQCGTKLADDAKFCHACGSKVVDMTETEDIKPALTKTPEAESPVAPRPATEREATENAQTVDRRDASEYIRPAPAESEDAARPQTDGENRKKTKARPSANPVKDRTIILIGLVVACIIIWIVGSFTEIFWLGKLIFILLSGLNFAMNLVDFIRSIKAKNLFRIFLFGSYMAVCFTLTIINFSLLL